LARRLGRRPRTERLVSVPRSRIPATTLRALSCCSPPSLEGIRRLTCSTWPQQAQWLVAKCAASRFIRLDGRGHDATDSQRPTDRSALFWSNQLSPSMRDGISAAEQSRTVQVTWTVARRHARHSCSSGNLFLLDPAAVTRSIRPASIHPSLLSRAQRR